MEMDRQYIEHFIDIDEMLELKMKIPKRLNALELKALMTKADKLFKLSEVQISATTPIGQIRDVRTYAKSMWNDEFLRILVTMKDNGAKVPQIGKKLNKLSNSTYFKNKRCWSKLNYLTKYGLINKYRGKAPVTNTEVPQEMKVSSTNNVSHKKGGFRQKIYTDEIITKMKEFYYSVKNSTKVKDELNKHFGTKFNSKQISDKLYQLKMKGEIK